MRQTNLNGVKIGNFLDLLGESLGCLIKTEVVALDSFLPNIIWELNLLSLNDRDSLVKLLHG